LGEKITVKRYVGLISSSVDLKTDDGGCDNGPNARDNGGKDEAFLETRHLVFPTTLPIIRIAFRPLLPRPLRPFHAPFKLRGDFGIFRSLFLLLLRRFLFLFGPLCQEQLGAFLVATHNCRFRLDLNAREFPLDSLAVALERDFGDAQRRIGARSRVTNGCTRMSASQRLRTHPAA